MGEGAHAPHSLADHEERRLGDGLEAFARVWSHHTLDVRTRDRTGMIFGVVVLPSWPWSAAVSVVERVVGEYLV